MRFLLIANDAIAGFDPELGNVTQEVNCHKCPQGYGQNRYRTVSESRGREQHNRTVFHWQVTISQGKVSMRYVLASLLLLTACGGSDATGPSNDVRLTGNWSFGGNMSSGQVSCTAQGTLAITQNGQQFSGNGQQVGNCTAPDGSSVDNSGLIQIAGGTITGNSVAFQGGVCNYQGTASGSPVNQMNGTSRCEIAIAGVNYVFTGTWQAGK